MELYDEKYDLTGPVDLVEHRRTAIKLRQNPTIVVCIPVGPTKVNAIFETPDGNKWQGDGFIAPAVVPLKWALNHMQIVTPLNTSMSYLVKWGERSAKARQFMTMEALNMNPDYVLYWDADTIVPPKSVYTLYNFMQQHPEAGLVSAVYCTREEPTEPLIYKRHGEGAYWGFQIGETAEPEEIFSAGAGFMLVRAAAIRKVMEMIPDTPVWMDELVVRLPGEDSELDRGARNLWGHDIRFCRLIAEAGYKVFVDGRVLCGHWDIRTNKMFELPQDSPPYKAKDNINTPEYWDAVYTQEVNNNIWRNYPELFDSVLKEIPQSGSNIFEIGCGVGVLGSRVTAQTQNKYSGVDISQTAVSAALTRFLTCRQCAVKNLTPDSEIQNASIVIATEVLEHLDEYERDMLFIRIDGSPSTKKFIFSVPNNCMSPEKVPEHRIVYTEESIRQLLMQHLPNWNVRIEFPDLTHMLVVAERGDFLDR